MNLKKLELLIMIFWLALALATLGLGPPPPPAPPTPETTPDVPPIRPATTVLDPSSAQPLPLTADGPPVEAPLAPAAQATAVPLPAVVAGYDGQELNFMSDPVGLEPLTLRGLSETSVIVSEDFEASVSPLWQVYDTNGPSGGNYYWGLEKCFSATGFPLGNFGSRSIWVAGAGSGTPSLNPCPFNNYDRYPANLDTWLVYGPFSLEDAESAWFDFYYWLDNGGDSDDVLSWGVSVDEGTPVNFYGSEVSGVFGKGPFINSSTTVTETFGHNFVSLDLTQVPQLGDVTGQPEVWIGFRFTSDNDGVAGRGAFIDSVSVRKNPGTQRRIISQNFETPFPVNYQSWLSHDNNGASGGSYRWGSADCKARSGTRSLWVAQNNGLPGGFNPCQGSPAYPANLDSWLLYGPFNLSGTDEAWLDFYFRSQSQAGGDYLFWWASIDGTHYYGPGLSGTYLTGPYRNGHNRMQLDLSQVPTLGDLRGKATVWIAFSFRSNGDAQRGEGPFVDDVSLLVVDKAIVSRSYLPLLTKADPVPVGGITFSNLTNNPLIVELIGLGSRTFPATQGPHTWPEIPAGTYDWIASGTCPAGAGQVGSLPPHNRQKVTVMPNKLNNPINIENGGKFDCSG